MVLVLAGNDALRTVKLATAGSSRFEQTPYVITGESRPAAPPRPPAGRRGQAGPGPVDFSAPLPNRHGDAILTRHAARQQHHGRRAGQAARAPPP